MLKKKIWANFQRIVGSLYPKIFNMLSNIWVWDPGSEIRDLGYGLVYGEILYFLVNSVHLPSDPVGGRLGQARGRGRGVARGRGKVGGREAGGRIGSCSGLPIPRSWRSAGEGGGRGRGIIPDALRLLPAAGDGSRR
jgi:hypothetical protein